MILFSTNRATGVTELITLNEATGEQVASYSFQGLIDFGPRLPFLFSDGSVTAMLNPLDFVSVDGFLQHFHDRCDVVWNSFTVDQGLYFGGTLASLLGSDNNRLAILCDEFDPNGQLTVFGTSRISNPTTATVTIESSTSHPNVIGFTELQNQSTLAWEIVDGALCQRTDTTRITNVTNAARFVSQPNKLVSLRRRFVTNADISLFDGWVYQIDQVGVSFSTK
jgi:hypothetical protein